MTEAHSTSWLQTLIPTSASWGVIAAELAVLFFLLAVLFGWFARRGRKRRIQAAADLLADRDDMADTATQTMAMHLKALLSGQDPSDADLVDYNKRSRKLIGALCQPWLEPSKGALRDAAHEILAIRHTDLHQFAGILGSPLLKESEEDKAALESTKQELVEVKKAEALRSKQLQEALTTIGTMVAEYGRKFEASTDSRTGQVLRALIYLQALDEGNDPDRAREIVDETLSEDLEVLKDQQEKEHQKSEAAKAPDAAAIAAAAAAEAADLSTELDAEAEMAAAMAEEEAARNGTTPGPEVNLDDQFDDLESIEPEADIAEIETVEQDVPSSGQPEEESVSPELESAPEAPAMGGMDALDDIDALIAQAQNQIDGASAAATADQAENPPAAEPTIEASEVAVAESQTDANPARQVEQAPEDIAPKETASQPEPKPNAPAAKAPSAAAEPTTAAEQAKARPADIEPAEPTLDEPKAEPEMAALQTETEPAPESQGTAGEAEEENEVVDLDDVELPQKAAAPKAETATSSIPDAPSSAEDAFDLDLDDIDALLDAEIARHQSPGTDDKPDDEDLDLSKP